MNFRETQQNLETQIAQSLDSIEGLHRVAVAQLFEQASQIAPIASLAGSVRPVYESGAEQVFEFGRKLNCTAGDVARALLDRTGL